MTLFLLFIHLMCKNFENFIMFFSSTLVFILKQLGEFRFDTF
jgi:hypothetical protein